MRGTRHLSICLIFSGPSLSLLIPRSELIMSLTSEARQGRGASPRAARASLMAINTQLFESQSCLRTLSKIGAMKIVAGLALLT